ncbi:hypothetical protein U1Q18_033561 [Sarracenia purpurea var. burkii]
MALLLIPYIYLFARAGCNINTLYVCFVIWICVWFLLTGGGGSDSDTISDELPEYYQQVSAGGDKEDVSDQSNSDCNSDEASRNGMSSLDLSDDEERKTDEDEEEEEEEELTRREASDSVIHTAFREDESRRNSPLTAETATRIKEAMRGVSFGGLAPDWADRIPEDQWIDQVRRLRRPPSRIHD